MEARAIGQACVHGGSGVIEATADRRGKTLGETTNILCRLKVNVRRLEPATAIDKHRIRAIDHHIRDTRSVEQSLEWASADQVVMERLNEFECRDVTHDDSLVA